jgi:hypothetical protein
MSHYFFSPDNCVKDKEYATEDEAVANLIQQVKNQAARQLDEHLLSLYKTIQDHENSRLLGCREDEQSSKDNPLGAYPEIRHIYPELGGQKQKRDTILGLLFITRDSDRSIRQSEFMKQLRDYWLPLYELEAVERLTEDLSTNKITIRAY